MHLDGEDQLLLLVVILLTIYLSWRLWRFTTPPLNRPKEPKLLPYWIPFVGHAISFFRNAYTLLDVAEKHFKATKDIYSITVMGNVIYVVTGIPEVTEIDNTFVKSSFQVFESRFFKSCGASDELVAKFYASLEVLPGPGKEMRSERKSVSRITHQMHLTQLSPGKHLTDFVSVSQRFFEKRLTFDRIRDKFYTVTNTDPSSITVKLLDFVSDFLVDAGQRMLFGDSIAKVDPMLAWTFIKLDGVIWKLLMNMPHIIARDVYRYRDHMIESITEYLNTPPSDRLDASVWVQQMESNMRDMGLSSREMATVMLPMYIGSNTSTRKACFWLLAFLLFNPALIEVVRKETTPAIQADGTIDLEYLKKHCPLLKAFWLETLRVCTSTGSFRMVEQDTIVGDKLLRKGRALLIPARQLHYDETVWGSEARRWYSGRFLADDKGTQVSLALSRSRSMRPFGGGYNSCPGKHAAEQQTFMFVALLLHSFNVELAGGGQRFPRFGEGDPFPGMMPVYGDDNLEVRLTPRQPVPLDV